jgi:hypothetical protein
MEKIISLKKSLEGGQSIVLVCNKESPGEALLDLCESAKGKFKKICIVSANMPYFSLAEKLKGRKIDFSKFHFIDCISASSMKQIPAKQCEYISSPRALTELAIALNNLSSETDLVILDSFSGLVLHNNILLVLRFMNSITSKFRQNSLKSVCLVVGETKKETLADLSLFADRVLSF